jgi:hypothetical protein
MLQLILTDSGTVTYLPLWRADTEVSGKQIGHGIVNLQLIPPTNLTFS